jgi:hypothetical protein
MFREFGLVPISLALDFSSYEDDWKHVAVYRGQSGWLLMASATIQSAHDILHANLIVACDAQENAIPSWRAVHLTQCQWSDLDHCHDEPPAMLDELLCEEEGALYARWQREANGELAALHEQSQRGLDALEAKAAIKARQLDRQIRDLRRRRRMTDNEAARAAFTSVIADMEAESDADAEWLIDRRITLRRRADAAEEALWQKTDVLIEVETLRLIHWRDGRPAAERALAPVWQAGRFYAPKFSGQYAEPEEADMLLAKVAAALHANAQRQAENRLTEAPNPAVGIDDLPKASPFLRKLASAAVVPAPMPVVPEPQPALAPIAIMQSNGASNGKLDIERDVLAGLLDGLEEKGQKFFPGSRKYLQNQEQRADMARRIAALDSMIVGKQAATPAELSDDHASVWDYKRVEMLRQLWLNGVSAGEIAKQIGGVSRNAVIGKAKRLGLPFNSTSEGETIS